MRFNKQFKNLITVGVRFGAEVYVRAGFPVKNRNSAVAELGVTRGVWQT